MASGFGAGFLQGLGGGMQRRQDRDMRQRELSAMEAMGQSAKPGPQHPQPGMTLPMSGGEIEAITSQGGSAGRANAGIGSGGVRPRSPASTSFDDTVLEGIENPQVRASLESAASTLGMNQRDQRVALQEYMANGGQNLDPAVTAWCAGWVNAALKQGGLEGTGKLTARSFMDWGEAADEPQIGDLAVFSRGDPNGWQGHVGFYKGKDEHGNIRVLGGNQSNSVNVSSYSPDRLLGYRRAPAAPGELSAAAAIDPAPTAPKPEAAKRVDSATPGATTNSWAWMRQMQQGAGT